MSQRIQAPKVIAAADKMVHYHVRGVQSFSLRLSSRPCYSYFAERHFTDTSAPLYEVLKRKWAKRPQNLWWNVNAGLTQCGKNKVVRSWLQRRVRKAVEEALRDRGLKVNGEWIGEEKRAALKGSVLFWIGEECLRANSNVLRNEVSKAVDFIIDKLEGDSERYSVPRRASIQGRAPGRKFHDATHDSKKPVHSKRTIPRTNRSNSQGYTQTARKLSSPQLKENINCNEISTQALELCATLWPKKSGAPKNTAR